MALLTPTFLSKIAAGEPADAYDQQMQAWQQQKSQAANIQAWLKSWQAGQLSPEQASQFMQNFSALRPSLKWQATEAMPEIRQQLFNVQGQEPSPQKMPAPDERVPEAQRLAYLDHNMALLSYDGKTPAGYNATRQDLLMNPEYAPGEKQNENLSDADYARYNLGNAQHSGLGKMDTTQIGLDSAAAYKLATQPSVPGQPLTGQRLLQAVKSAPGNLASSVAAPFKAAGRIAASPIQHAADYGRAVANTPAAVKAATGIASKAQALTGLVPAAAKAAGGALVKKLPYVSLGLDAAGAYSNLTDSNARQRYLDQNANSSMLTNMGRGALEPGKAIGAYIPEAAATPGRLIGMGKDLYKGSQIDAESQRARQYGEMNRQRLAAGQPSLGRYVSQQKTASIPELQNSSDLELAGRLAALQQMQGIDDKLVKHPILVDMGAGALAGATGFGIAKKLGAPDLLASGAGFGTSILGAALMRGHRRRQLQAALDEQRAGTPEGIAAAKAEAEDFDKDQGSTLGRLRDTLEAPYRDAFKTQLASSTGGR